MATTSTTTASTSTTPIPTSPVSPPPTTRDTSSYAATGRGRDTAGYSASGSPSTSVAATRSTSLSAGTIIAATTQSELSSRTNKVGETIGAAVTSDVRDAAGQVVIPAGSIITLRITAIGVSENRSDSTGALTLVVDGVDINGTRHPLDADAHVNTQLAGRSTNVNDVAKVGAGAAAGAVVGRVLGGKKGTIIGGVLGGAVGAPVASRLRNRFVAAATP